MNRIQELQDKLSNARKDYYNGEASVSDEVYDAWLTELKELDPENFEILTVGAATSSEWPKAKHSVKMGSLNKVSTSEEMKKWLTDNLLEKIVITEKLDGLAIELVYVNGEFKQAITRGSVETNEGEDITPNILKMNGAPKEIKNFSGSIRAEIVLKRENHKKYFSDKANPRNAASGISKRLDGLGCEYLDIFSHGMEPHQFKNEYEIFEWLKDNKFQIPNYYVVNSTEEIIKIWNEYQSYKRDKLDYDIDGLVLACNDTLKQKDLGELHHRPRAKVAFKFSPEMKESIIKEIIWSVGNSGRIAPVAIIAPTYLAGATITKASLYNASYISELKLDVGATILICRRGDIIPRIEQLVKGTGTVAEYPEHCPCCGDKTHMNGENLMCLNQNCPAIVSGKIKTWISVLNILEWGDKLINRLCESGKVKNISDLYSLTINDLKTIERMGEKSALKCHSLLWAKGEIPLELFLGGLSIPMISVGMIKILINAGYNSLEKILELTLETACVIEGMGSIKAKYLIDGLKQNKQLIDIILSKGIKIMSINTNNIIGNLSGLSFCFTGKSSLPRKELQDMVLRNGGEVKSSISKGLNYLVCANTESTSSKAQKAKGYGTLIISEDDFYKLVGK